MSAKKKIFLGDLKNKKTRSEHFVYPQKDLIEDGYIITKCLYDINDATRYNAIKEVK